MTQSADPVHPPEGSPPFAYSETEGVREMTAITISMGINDDPVRPPEGYPPLAYSEEEVVREMTAFYRFLTTLHIPPSALRLAPKNGWKAVTARRLHLAVGRKDPAVLSLAQRLPYISHPSYEDGHELAPRTIGLAYAAKSHLAGQIRLAEAQAIGGRKETDEEIMAGGQKLRDAGLSPDELELVVPEHMLVIAISYGWSYRTCWMLNTRNGTITIVDGGIEGGKEDGLCDVDQPEVKSNETEREPNETTTWPRYRTHETYYLPGFLSLMKRRFRALHYHPVDEYQVFDGVTQDELRAFRECGWHEEQQGDDDEGLGDRREECFRRINPDYDEDKAAREDAIAYEDEYNRETQVVDW